MDKKWKVAFVDEFDPEFEALPEAVQDELLASAQLLVAFGPQLSRPHADTLNDSSFANMKELRFDADGGVWRVAFGSIPSGSLFCWSQAKVWRKRKAF